MIGERKDSKGSLGCGSTWVIEDPVALPWINLMLVVS